MKIMFDFRPAVPAATNLIGYAHFLTNNLVSVSIDGQKQYDLVKMKFNFLKTVSFFFNVKFDFFSEASLYLSDKLSIT